MCRSDNVHFDRQATAIRTARTTQNQCKTQTPAAKPQATHSRGEGSIVKYNANQRPAEASETPPPTRSNAIGHPRKKHHTFLPCPLPSSVGGSLRRQTRYDLVKLKTHRPNGPPKVPDPYLSGTVVYVSEARVWQASVLRLKGAITIFTITVLRVSLLSFALRPRCFERSSPSSSPP